MYLLMLYMLLIMSITWMLTMTPMFVSKLMKKWSNKSTSFECGMALNSTPRKPFSIQFFLLMMLFIIFDIEIALILAVPVLTLWSSQMMMFFTMFSIILASGIFYEWLEGSLSWKL